MARRNDSNKRHDWEQVKDQIMATALHAKFTQYENLMQMLLGTGDAILVENSPIDRYWGNGGDGKCFYFFLGCEKIFFSAWEYFERVKKRK